MAEAFFESLIPSGLATNSLDCSYLNSDSKSDLGDTSSQGTNDERLDKDLGGLSEDRFRVDRRKLERMLQGKVVSLSFFFKGRGELLRV